MPSQKDCGSAHEKYVNTSLICTFCPTPDAFGTRRMLTLTISEGRQVRLLGTELPHTQTMIFRSGDGGCVAVEQSHTDIDAQAW